MSRSLPEWQAKHDDQAIPARVKDRICQHQEDKCAQCQRPVGGKLRPEFDHVIPLILGGRHAEGNLRLVCNECHAAKTRLDVKLKAKVARVRKRHLGVRKARTMTRWRKFSGAIVTATRERQ